MRRTITLPSQVVAALLPSASDTVTVSNVAMYTNERVLESIGKYIEEKTMRNPGARLYGQLTLSYDDKEKA